MSGSLVTPPSSANGPDSVATSTQQHNLKSCLIKSNKGKQQVRFDLKGKHLVLNPKKIADFLYSSNVEMQSYRNMRLQIKERMQELIECKEQLDTLTAFICDPADSWDSIEFERHRLLIKRIKGVAAKIVSEDDTIAIYEKRQEEIELIIEQKELSFAGMKSIQTHGETLDLLEVEDYLNERIDFFATVLDSDTYINKLKNQYIWKVDHLIGKKNSDFFFKVSHHNSEIFKTAQKFAHLRFKASLFKAYEVTQSKEQPAETKRTHVHKLLKEALTIMGKHLKKVDLPAFFHAPAFNSDDFNLLITHAPNIESIRLSTNYFMGALKNFQKLKSLYFDGSNSSSPRTSLDETQLKELLLVSTLEELTIKDFNLDTNARENLSYLGLHQKLRHLTLIGNYLLHEQIAAGIASSQSLEFLHIAFNPKMREDFIEALKPLFSRLEKLIIEACPNITLESLVASELPVLECLRVTSCALLSKNLAKKISQFPMLKELTLSKIMWKDEEFAELKSDSLKNLYVDTPFVLSEDTLKNLILLPELHHLTISQEALPYPIGSLEAIELFEWIKEQKPSLVLVIKKKEKQLLNNKRVEYKPQPFINPILSSFLV